ncbi:MAG: asparagine--tRNA ligase [Candidatus Babeliales bacterium]|jgi:asparaginyl-tRNA synthetase
MRTKIKQLTTQNIGTTVTIKGWVRSVRNQKSFSFITINDGSTLAGLQAIYQATAPGYEETIKNITTGASIAATGTLVKSVGKEQAFELDAHNITIVGLCDSETYPLQKKHHTFEFLRTIAHLRPRTNTLGAVARVRNALSYATHQFFNERGFLYVHTPLITGSDCEGAGQMFNVTTLDINNPTRTPAGTVDYTQDFFGRKTFLTVSGQLEGETYACALSDIYTFGPTFRAENSNTSRHLAEFWMIEPEMAFADLQDNMDCAEQYLKHVLRYLLNNCAEDMKFFDAYISKGVIAKLEHVINTSFQRLTYTEGVKILQSAPKKFEYPVSWGTDLQSEHERYLAEEYFKKPVILINYPAQIKAFYMRLNEDQKTVAAMDILVPSVGEIIGGSQREDRLDLLVKRMEELKLPVQDYAWYLELRKYGSVPHAGFGLGLERLILFATGMENIRDVIPFPRYPKHAEF